MAYKPDADQAPLLQPTPVQHPVADEWDGVVPRQGLKHLLRMSLVVLGMSTINLACQIYLATLVSSTGTDYFWDNTPSSAIWAAAIGLCAALYMLFVTNCAVGGMRHAKFHMVFALVGCGIACGFLLSGMVMSAVTTDNLSNTQLGYRPICIYFNSTGQGDVTPTPGTSSCYNCDTRDNVIPPKTCCCCSSQDSWYNSMTFYGVDNCQDVLAYGYPIAFTSSILYGASLALTFVICIITCVVGCCRCYSCSSFCGPFAQEGGVCCRTRTFGNQYGHGYGHGCGQNYGTHVITAHPVTAMPVQPGASYHVNAAPEVYPPGTNPSSHPSLSPSAPVERMQQPIQQDYRPSVPPPYTGTSK